VGVCDLIVPWQAAATNGSIEPALRLRLLLLPLAWAALALPRVRRVEGLGLVGDALLLWLPLLLLPAPDPAAPTTLARRVRVRHHAGRLLLQRQEQGEPAAHEQQRVGRPPPQGPCGRRGGSGGGGGRRGRLIRLEGLVPPAHAAAAWWGHHG
jgi:hypothetical protein